MANEISMNMPGRIVQSVPADSVISMEKAAPQSSKENDAPSSPGGQASALADVVSGLNEMVQNLHRNLQFSVDDESGETVIKVVDSETNEVVRQIPSEEIVRLRRRLKEASGVLFQGAV